VDGKASEVILSSFVRSKDHDEYTMEDANIQDDSVKDLVHTLFRRI